IWGTISEKTVSLEVKSSNTIGDAKAVIQEKEGPSLCKSTALTPSAM
ncbi:hypothetical protein Tco_1462031, partial [Tanacetum coccineum]